MNRAIDLILRIVVSLAIFIVVMFFVAWLLEDVIYFSLFIGIPAGLISALIAFVVLTRYRGKS
ncbi:MAG TPA: hypothetical protein ENN68_00865 [Methanomicrobia archaeon]|nr:hypothetical protein [Methanomicrobia archaeon]